MVGVLGYLVSMVEILHDFRTQTLLMRRGKSMFQEEGKEREASLVDAAEFPGLFVINCMLGFLLFCAVFMLIFTVFYHPLLWLYLYENLWYIALVLIPFALEFLIDFLCEKFVYDDEVAYRYVLIGQIYELYKFLTAFLSGIAVEIGRIFYAVLALLFALIRMDRPMIPQWVYELLEYDSMFKAYVSLVGVYESYNNPVANTFVRLLLESHEARLRCRGMALFRRIVQRRWLVIQGRRKMSIQSRDEDVTPSPGKETVDPVERGIVPCGAEIMGTTPYEVVGVNASP